MYQEYLEDFIQDVHDQCKENRCSKCRYYDDSNESCMFCDDPEDWDLEMIINAYYSKYRETADVQPVKRGKWEGVDYDTFFKCSECGHMTDWQRYKYCPYCGAKMEGD